MIIQRRKKMEKMNRWKEYNYTCTHIYVKLILQDNIVVKIAVFNYSSNLKTQISRLNIYICFRKDGKRCWKWGKCWLSGFSPFPTMLFFKRPISQGRENLGLCGKGLMTLKGILIKTMRVKAKMLFYDKCFPSFKFQIWSVLNQFPNKTLVFT